jgi:hypothetical protein
MVATTVPGGGKAGLEVAYEGDVTRDRVQELLGV